jgi:hypothetical protein
VSALYSAVPEIDVNRNAWTPSVFYADSSTPRRTWTLSDGWVVDNVPTPSNLGVSPEPETWTVIVDAARGLEYDFFDATKSSSSPSGWTARNGGVGRLNGSGWWNNNLGPWIGHASGGENLGGLILKADADAGRIDHALACSLPKNLIATTAVSPALTSDGSGPSSAMPMGSRLQLDPSYSLAGMESGEAMIARALQTYGCYVIDSSSGGFVLFAQNYNFLPGGANPYPSSWGNGITKELVKHMRVVAPVATPTYDDRTVLGQPHK